MVGGRQTEGEWSTEIEVERDRVRDRGEREVERWMRMQREQPFLFTTASH